MDDGDGAVEGVGGGGSGGAVLSPMPGGWLRWGNAVLQQGWASCTAPVAAATTAE